jgi:hypothetical protein
MTREDAELLIRDARQRGLDRWLNHPDDTPLPSQSWFEFDEIAAAIQAAVAEERERSLAKVREIGGYYPTDVFREISRMETQAVHEHYPGIVDRISASMARFVVKRIVEEIEAEPPEDAP